MEFTFDTAYNLKTLTALSRTLRKTIRKKRSRRAHIFGWLVIVLSLFISLPFGKDDYSITFRTVLTWLVVAILFATLIFEDTLNGYVALRRGLPGLTHSHVVFNSEGYHSSTDIGQSDFPYANVTMLAETKDYFVFVFSKSHGQIYDKRSISGGTVDEFREFISTQFKKPVQLLK